MQRLQQRLSESERQREEHEQVLEERERRIEQLLDYITLFRRKLFGPSTDRIPAGQLKLFDEAELEALIDELEQEAEPSRTPAGKPSDGEKPKGKPVRRPLPEHLSRVERIIDLPEGEKQALGSDWRFIGYDESGQMAVIPRQPYVIRFKRAKYVPLNEEVGGPSRAGLGKISLYWKYQHWLPC